MRNSKRYILNKQIIYLNKYYFSLVRFLVRNNKFIEAKPILDDLCFMIDELYNEINKWKNIIDFNL